MLFIGNVYQTVIDIHPVWHWTSIKPLLEAVITRSILSKSSQKTSHSSPYVVYFVNAKSDLCSTVFIALLYVMAWYIASCYNGTQLYMHHQT